MNRIIYILIVILLHIACNNNKEIIDGSPEWLERDTSLSGSIIASGYAIEDGSTYYDNRKVVNVPDITIQYPAMMIDIDKNDDRSIKIGIVSCWNDTILNIHSDVIQLTGETGNVIFDNIEVNAKVRLNNHDTISIMKIDGYLHNITYYSRLSLRYPEYECYLNITSEYDEKYIVIEINSIQSANH